MYEWIVHVERENIRDWEVNVTLPGQRQRRYICSNSTTIDVEDDLDYEAPEKAETWYCADELVAKALALKISTRAPGRNVNVYKLAHVARSQVVNPTITPYNEKGLIPE